MDDHDASKMLPNRSLNMKRYVSLAVFLCVAVPATSQPSPGKAAALSVLLPGLGHSYANGGNWHGTATYLALTEAGLWLGLASSQWQRHQTIQSYRTFAATHAGAQLEGKDRRFLVTLGTYLSSDAYREDHLRQRQWDQVGYISDPSFQWEWQSEATMLTYGHLRRAADTWTRRRTVFIATLAANRILAALTALQTARKKRQAPITLALTPSADIPIVHMTVRL